VAERLLTRASELDALGRANSTLAELRAAAAEAGISSAAFDAALAEMKAETATPVPLAPAEARGRRNGWMRTVALLGLMFAAVIGYRTMRIVPPAPAAPLVEEVVLLQCLPAAEAAALVRPLLRSPEGTIVMPADAPRALTIRATEEQLRRVKAAIEEAERASGRTCPAQ
jgi:hypothetical protein